MKNNWTGHPTFDYATFQTFYLNVFGNDCIVESYQDGEIWSDEEYYGSTLYDITDGKIYKCGFYVETKNEWEKLINKRKENNKKPWDEKIEEYLNQFPNDIDAYNFYKNYINSKSELDLPDFYKKMYKEK